jgi:hypothetical protein
VVAFWGIGVQFVNANVVYCKVMDSQWSTQERLAVSLQLQEISGVRVDTLKKEIVAKKI